MRQLLTMRQVSPMDVLTQDRTRTNVLTSATSQVKVSQEVKRLMLLIAVTWTTLTVMAPCDMVSHKRLTSGQARTNALPHVCLPTAVDWTASG